MKLTAETLIESTRETVWRLSQTPELHTRWDLRFTDIEYLPRASTDEPQRFHYATRIGFGLAVKGWGETIGHPDRATSALRFGSTQASSLIREGTGSWTYLDSGRKVCFSTVYDYATRYGALGRLIDLLFRPLMIWATRWSFDRLRIWIEDGVQPEMSFRLWLVKVVTRSSLALTWIHEGLVPKILAQRADEIALVRESGLYWSTPSHTLAALGFAEIAFGLWLLSGRSEKLAAIFSTLGIASLATLVVSLRPAVLSDPLGGVSKDLGLLACGLVVYVLSDSSPLACRAKPTRRRETRDDVQSPFAMALGEDLHLTAPLVRAHLTPRPGVYRYEGIMTTVWRVEGLRRWLTAPFLWAGSWMHTLFPETGEEVPFEIVNRLVGGADGVARMTFERTFRLPGVERRFEATMRYDATRDIILDALGRPPHLLVELVSTAEGGGITLRTRRQWLTPFGLALRIPLPRVLVGEATIEEWQESELSLGIRVTISNRLFGRFFGYEGVFHRVDESAAGIPLSPATPIVRPRLLRGARAALFLFACMGTAAYAASFSTPTITDAARVWGVRIAKAAVISWPAFGLALLRAAGPGQFWAWVDVCLRTMARGIIVLTVATVINVALAVAGMRAGGIAFFATHLSLLLTSDVTMATVFVREAICFGLSPRMALGLWVGVLNGVFALSLVLL